MIKAHYRTSDQTKYDLRYRGSKEAQRRRFINFLLAEAVLVFLGVLILGATLIKKPQKAPSKPLGMTEDMRVVKVAEAVNIPFCYDPITCIRDVGEELGVPNKDILTMIRIGKCESGLRPEALGVNTNKTVDRGVFQVNSIHKTLSNADAFDFQKNIRYAYKLYLAQGFNPWSSSAKCWNK